MNRSTKLEAAKRLLNSLHDEQERWQSQLDDIQRGLRYDVVGVACFPPRLGVLSHTGPLLSLVTHRSCLGDALLSSSFLTYAGPFGQRQRLELMKALRGALRCCTCCATTHWIGRADHNNMRHLHRQAATV